MAAPDLRDRDGYDVFASPHSLRWPTERRAFWLTLIFAPATIGFVGLVIPEHFTAQQIAGLIVVAMVYVTIARGRLLGTSIRAHERQLPELNRIVARCARLLRLPMPHVFVREDLFVCITGMGLGQPYSLALSSQWLPHLEEDELAFLVGAELGHIAAGHTRLTSLFSASGKENPIVALVFGAWLRRTEYSADRVGLLCCGSLDAAIRAIFKCSFHPLASRVSFVAFADQRRELAVDPGLKMGEWLGETPYAVNRLRELQQFQESDLFARWKAEFDRRRAELDSADSLPVEVPWTPKDAGIFQRALAFFVDYIVVSTIVSGVDVLSEPTKEVTLGKNAHVPPPPDSFAQTLDTWLQHHGLTLTASLDNVGTTFLVLAYSALLVAFTGRTFGMMIFGLRVVRNDLGRVSGWRSVWRYFLASISLVLVFPLLFGLFKGRLLHDRLSRTRVVRGGA
jgi:Zn-dependent protease with chaperone function/uncharacterized RDD family membrane protein YckC